MYVAYLAFCIFGAVVIFRVVRIQFTSKTAMAKQTEALKTQMRVIEAFQKQNAIQLILTTHSPNLASKLKLESNTNGTRILAEVPLL